jgi:hypothetical protein
VIYIEFPWKPEQGMQIPDQGKIKNRTGMAMRNEWFGRKRHQSPYQVQRVQSGPTLSYLEKYIRMGVRRDYTGGAHGALAPGGY